MLLELLHKNNKDTYFELFVPQGNQLYRFYIETAAYAKTICNIRRPIHVIHISTVPDLLTGLVRFDVFMSTCASI